MKDLGQGVQYPGPLQLLDVLCSWSLLGDPPISWARWPWLVTRVLTRDDHVSIFNHRFQPRRLDFVFSQLNISQTKDNTAHVIILL